MSNHARALLIIGCAVLAACGGGGGGGGGGGSPPPAPDLAITSDNAFDVASAVVIAVGATFDIGTGVWGGTDGGPQVLAAQGVAARRSLARAHHLLQSDRVTTSIAFGPVTEPCLVTGFVTLSGDIDNPDTLSVGDRINTDLDQCDDGDGFMLDGGLDLVVLDTQGDPLGDQYLLELDLDLTNLAVTDDSGTATADGSFTLTLDQLDYPFVVTSFIGDVLELVASGEDLTLSGFEHVLAENFGALPTTHQANAKGALASARLGGKVRYLTDPEDEVFGEGDDDPKDGTIEITGAGNSRVDIVIVDTGLVVLEVDADGDGTIDETIDTTWTALEGGPSTVTSAASLDIAREAYTVIGQFGSSATALSEKFQDGLVFSQLAALGPGTVAPTFANCPNVGFAMVSGDLQAGGTFTPGDTLRAEFDTCTGGPEVLNGQADLTVGSWQSTGGTGFTYAVTFTATVSNLQRAFTGQPTVTGNGTFTHSFDGVSQPGQLQMSISADAFQVADASATRRLSDAQSAGTFSSPAPGTFVFESTVSGGMVSSELSGFFTYETLAPLQSVSDNDPATGPQSGALKVTATDGSSVTLVAVSNLDVRLDVDLDGDGDVDETQDLNWVDIR